MREEAFGVKMMGGKKEEFEIHAFIIRLQEEISSCFASFHHFHAYQYHGAGDIHQNINIYNLFVKNSHTKRARGEKDSKRFNNCYLRNESDLLMTK